MAKFTIGAMIVPCATSRGGVNTCAASYLESYAYVTTLVLIQVSTRESDHVGSVCIGASSEILWMAVFRLFVRSSHHIT